MKIRAKHKNKKPVKGSVIRRIRVPREFMEEFLLYEPGRRPAVNKKVKNADFNSVTVYTHEVFTHPVYV